MKGVDALWHDVVFATRLLRKSPVFSTAVVLTLALGVGVNTAVFSVVNAIILRPLPIRDGNQLVVIASRHTSNPTLSSMSFSDVQDYRAATRDVFEDIAGYSVGFLGLTPQGGRPERVLVTWITGNYFPLLDVRPVLGRVIRPDEVDAAGPTLWSCSDTRHGNADSAVIGQL